MIFTKYEESSLKKISARKILYLYVAPRTFTGECCNITYLYFVDPDPCVVGKEHEVTYLVPIASPLHGGEDGGVSFAFSGIF